MANRTGGRRASGKKGTAKGRNKNANKQVEHAAQPQNNREIVYQKLEELTAPVLEKYGVTAFDELMNRLENTIKEFTDEVNTLFTAMVSRSREDHERLKSLLTEEECEEEEQELELENEENMSAFEKKLERMEQENVPKTAREKGK